MTPVTEILKQAAKDEFNAIRADLDRFWYYVPDSNSAKQQMIAWRDAAEKVAEGDTDLSRLSPGSLCRVKTAINDHLRRTAQVRSIELDIERYGSDPKLEEELRNARLNEEETKELIAKIKSLESA